MSKEVEDLVTKFKEKYLCHVSCVFDDYNIGLRQWGLYISNIGNDNPLIIKAVSFSELVEKANKHLEDN